MDLNYSKEEKLFQNEVKNWIKENLPISLRNKVLKHKRLSKDDYAFGTEN